MSESNVDLTDEQGYCSYPPPKENTQAMERLCWQIEKQSKEIKELKKVISYTNNQEKTTKKNRCIPRAICAVTTMTVGSIIAFGAIQENRGEVTLLALTGSSIMFLSAILSFD